MILYIDAATGASGDKLLASLIQIAEELGVYTRDELNVALGRLIPGLRVDEERVVLDFMRARRIAIVAPDDQPRRTWRDISELLLTIQDESVRKRAYSAFLRIARAEALVHLTPLEDVHFHEIGAVDTIGDIVGAALVMTALSPSRVICSPVATGSGTVEIEHGVVDVPAPATAELLRGIPTELGAVEGELTTPTGAALLGEYVTSFGALPEMTIDAVGYGAGTKRFPGMVNVLRILAGRRPDEGGDLRVEGLIELTTNIDHVAPEAVAYLVTLLLDRGALDAFTAPITMKKGRLALELTALARPEDADELAGLIHREVGTLGVRRRYVERTALGREVVELDSEWGPVRYKVAQLDDGLTSVRPEHDDVARIARAEDLPYRDVRDRLIASGEDELLGG